MQFLAAHVAITERDARVELSAVEESVGAITDTARVVAALIVVGKGAPFRTSVDGALLKNETAVTADEITTRVVFAKVWWILATVATDHAHVQILLPFFFLGWEELVGDGAWGEDLCHDGERLARRWSGTRVDLDKAGMSALADAFGRFLKFEFFGERADEEWRVRGGGCDGVEGRSEEVLSVGLTFRAARAQFPQYEEIEVSSASSDWDRN